MKFMKLGSKPDTFQANGSSIRYVSSELATDITVRVGEVKFLLHKFPLLSKSGFLQKLILKDSEGSSEEIQLDGFPGGPKAFEICAKFCYGMTVTLNAHNVVAARCAAEFLEMTEDAERGNLVFKIEVFLNSSIFRSWKDSIIVLQTTKFLLPWSENLKIVGRCVDSIASKTSVDPAKVTWSYTHNRKLAMQNKIVEHDSMVCIPKDWWVEDICELDIDMYKQVLVAIKSKGRMDGVVIGEALKIYAVRHLPDSVEGLVSDDHIQRNRSLIETIICLFPSERGSGCSCSFLLKLLKAAILVEADDSVREDLIQKISLKLDEASVTDLLIPTRSPQSTNYDIELVQLIVKRFATNEKLSWGNDSSEKAEGIGLNVGRLVDAYLAVVASDPNLRLSSFIEFAQLIPASARPTHDGLYKAIDIYLKEHPGLSKSERKKISGLMDVKKLGMDASIHAAQNDRLPLRVVVQVLFFEQIRAAIAGQAMSTPSYISNSSQTAEEEEEWDNNRSLKSSSSLRQQMDQMKIEEEETEKKRKMKKQNDSRNKSGGNQLLPSRSKRLLDKMWVIGGGKGNRESNKSSETSGTSHSPVSLVPGDVDSSSSSARHRRHSIS